MRQLLRVTLLTSLFALTVFWPAPARAQYPADLSDDIPWIPDEWWDISITEIATAYSDARAGEKPTVRQ